MSFTIIEGDLFDPEHNFTALAQGVNCRGIMGAGIAVPFKNKFPDMYTEYKKLCSDYASLLSGTAQVWIGDGQAEDVINLFSQFHPGANAKQEYLESALFSMDTQLNLIGSVINVVHQSTHRVQFTTANKQRIGLPLIGGGIGGLQRHNIINSMELILGPSNHEYILVEQPK